MKPSHRNPQNSLTKKPEGDKNKKIRQSGLQETDQWYTVLTSCLNIKDFHRSFEKSLVWRPPKEILGILDAPFFNTDSESFINSFLMVFLRLQKLEILHGVYIPFISNLYLKTHKYYAFSSDFLQRSRFFDQKCSKSCQNWVIFKLFYLSNKSR